MGGFAGGALAAAVTQAGGLGQIGALYDMVALEKELTLAQETLGNLATTTTPTTLPIGVGLLPFVLKLEAVLPLLQRFQPAVIWLFAAKEVADYADWTRQLHAALPHSSVWIQVGSASAALTVARGGSSSSSSSDADPTTQPDALVLQGSDAGGHGFERGASIVSLIPETLDLLRQHSLTSSTSSTSSTIPILAAGGISDSRGAAAAFALGASGVVLGTRFLAARETTVPHAAYRDAVLAARDGGVSTVRSKLFDNVKGPNIWPEIYDGRSLVTRNYTDFAAGVEIEVVRERHALAVGRGDEGFADADADADAGEGGKEGETSDASGGENGAASGRRANIWAGAGVGLVNELQDAAEIVREVRTGVEQVLRDASTRIL